MKTHAPFLTALAVALLPALALAAKDGKPEKKKAPSDAGPGAGDVVKSHDKNGDQKLDAEELAALQQTFAQLRKLDQNGNGEIESSEVAPANGDRKARAMAGLKKADKNANGKIDTDEAEGLQKGLAGSRVMEKLDRNGNGKLDGEELERLNQRLAQGGRDKKSQNLGSKPAPKPAPAVSPATPSKPGENSKVEPEGVKTEKTGEAKPGEKKQPGEAKKPGEAKQPGEEKDVPKETIKKGDPFLPKAE